MALRTTGIDHVDLQVKNLDESCRFWRDLMGFEVLEDMPEHAGRVVGTVGAKLALYENPQLAPDHDDSFSHISIQVENFHEVEAVCQGLGVEVKYGGPVQWLRSRAIYIDDPNGYEIELAEVGSRKL